MRVQPIEDPEQTRREVQQLRESLGRLQRERDELKKSEEQLSDFVENATLGLHRVGPDGSILWANRAELELLGYAPDEYLGHSISEFHADQPVVADILARLTRGEALHDYEARLRAKDGSIKHVLISSSVYRRDGRFIHTRCFTRDITERRRMEEAVRLSELQLRSITDALPVLVSFVDRDRRYQFVSAAYERWFGQPSARLLGRKVEDVLGAAAYETVRPHLDQALSGQVARYEAHMNYRSGGLRLIEATYIPQFGPDQRVSGCVALVLDLTEKKEFERFTRSVVSAERVEEVFEAALDAIQSALGANHAAILLYDQHGVMRFRAARQLSIEYQRAVEGHSPWPRDAVAPQPVLVPDVEKDAQLSGLLPLLRREGIASLAFVPLVTRGQLIGKFMLYYDQPHSYSLQELETANAIAGHLASVAARFAAIAKLEETIRYNELFAGVLAHDLRNPLGAMMMAAQVLLLRQEGPPDRNAKALGRILSSGQRMTRMVDQLLDFTRTRVGGGIVVQPRPANLADLCNQAIGELEIAYPEWLIQREVLGDQDGSWDPDRLLQIVSNLVGNAGQHGDADGRIIVTLDGRQPEFVSLRVHNSGVIPESLMPSLFDPFRGTRHRRDQSRGLGLGLFIVDALARAHGGKVDVSSSESAGTSFTVTLPRRTPGARGEAGQGA